METVLYKEVEIWYDDASEIKIYRKVEFQVKRIKTLVSRDLAKSAKTGGCGECQTSCQSASKTSCSVANQQCEQKK